MINISESCVGEEEKKAALAVLDSGWFIHGERTKLFEENFSRFVGAKHAIACCNGTAAIFLALSSLGIKAGDEVIVPSHTAYPTIQPILNLQAKPVFVEVDEKTFTIDPKEIRKNISKKTKGIIAVHLYGHPANLDPIKETCVENSLFLLEDCAQAHGTEYKGKKVGSIGDISCFSFYPSKNMTVAGDGGMVVTNNDQLAEKVKLLRNHGLFDRYTNKILGYNFRISELASAIGNEQLKKLPSFNQRRRELAKIYNELLSSTNIITPIEAEWAKHIYHLYVIRTDKRDSLKDYLSKNEIKSEVHYPIPGHMQQATPKKYRVNLPKTEKLAKEILSLPMHPKLSDEDVMRICRVVKGFIHNES